VNEDRPLKLGKPLEFMRSLWALDHALQSRSKAMAAALGVTGPQRMVVRLVGRFPDIAAGSLAELLMIHPSTLTGIVQRLESRGLLERKPDPSDGRRALLRLTDKARSLDREAEGTIELVVKRVLSRMPESAVEQARALVDALAVELREDEPITGADPAAPPRPPSRSTSTARRRRAR
jgi:MarR family transcriptional regulator, organic hydroperoxide resistance regulator